MVRSALHISHPGDMGEINGVKKKGEQNDMAGSERGPTDSSP